MGAVDTLDQELKYYDPQRRTLRWTFKFSIYILQLLLFNSYVLYKKHTTDKKLLTFMNFRLVAIKWFVKKEKSNFIPSISTCENKKQKNDNSSPNNLIENTINTLSGENSSRFQDSTQHIANLSPCKHIPLVLKKRTTCSYCYKQGKNSKTQFYCIDCTKALCMNKSRLCWFEYHSKLKDSQENE